MGHGNKYGENPVHDNRCRRTRPRSLTDKATIKNTSQYIYLEVTQTNDERDEKDIEDKVQRTKTIIIKLYLVLSS